jgi:allophanate hydrolase
MEPFYRTARLLYEGPWVAERYIAARSVIESAPQSLHPVTREIILGGARYSAADAFAAFYQLQELRRSCERAFARIEALALPTIPRAYRRDEMLADPIELNSRLGTYTNFVNLLDLCALSVPAAILPDGIPFGVTLIGRAGEDAALAAIGRLFHAETELPMGATGRMHPLVGAER